MLVLTTNFPCLPCPCDLSKYSASVPCDKQYQVQYALIPEACPLSNTMPCAEVLPFGLVEHGQMSRHYEHMM